MPNITRFASALSSINRYFASTKKIAFAEKELKEIFENYKNVWRLPLSMNAEKFIIQLSNKAGFKRLEFTFPGEPTKKVYTIGEAPTLEIAAALFPKSYLSHFTAMSSLGLTEQIAKVVYITMEQSKKAVTSTNLTQSGIDLAFQKPQRISETRLTWNDFEFVLLKGKHTSNMGVRPIGQGRAVRITDIERTLIDITVRPAYSGGVFEVLKAFRIANQVGNVSINKLLAYLTKLDFIYPYHQAIGFYMERSGAYKEVQLDKLRAINRTFKFYLTYDMKEMEFSKEWNIYYPKGM